MLRPAARLGDAPLARPEEIGKRRGAQIDHHVPAPQRDRAIKRQPMQRPAPLGQADEPLEPRHVLEEGCRVRTRGNGEARAGKAVDEVRQQPGRENGVAVTKRIFMRPGYRRGVCACQACAPRLPLAALARTLRVGQSEAGLMTERVYAELPGRGVLEVAGEDRVAFLQGLVTNDVTKAGATRA